MMFREHIKNSTLQERFKLLTIFAATMTGTFLLTACSASLGLREPNDDVTKPSSVEIGFEANGEIPVAVRNFADNYVIEQVAYYINDCD